MRVTFLGTAAARPTVGRNVSALTIQREGDTMLFDCGEGTQRQMMRFGTGFSIRDVFFTHLHADHFLGIIGLLRTMSLQDRTEPISLHTPAGTEELLHQAVYLGADRIAFPVAIVAVEPGGAVTRAGYSVVPFRTQHRGALSVGYSVTEPARLGRFDAAKARDLGVPEGPLWGKLHHGEAVEVDGRTVHPNELVGPPRPGRKVVYSGDTRPCAATWETAAAADLLIHEATFGADERARAIATGHSTAREAAEVAAKAGAVRLVLTHFSPRYADDPRVLEKEARSVFEASQTAHDGLLIEVPLRS